MNEHIVRTHRRGGAAVSVARRAAEKRPEAAYSWTTWKLPPPSGPLAV